MGRYWMGAINGTDPIVAAVVAVVVVIVVAVYLAAATGCVCTCTSGRSLFPILWFNSGFFLGFFFFSSFFYFFGFWAIFGCVRILWMVMDGSNVSSWTAAYLRIASGTVGHGTSLNCGASGIPRWIINWACGIAGIAAAAATPHRLRFPKVVRVIRWTWWGQQHRKDIRILQIDVRRLPIRWRGPGRFPSGCVQLVGAGCGRRRRRWLRRWSGRGSGTSVEFIEIHGTESAPTARNVHKSRNTCAFRNLWLYAFRLLWKQERRLGFNLHPLQIENGFGMIQNDSIHFEFKSNQIQLNSVEFNHIKLN